MFWNIYKNIYKKKSLSFKGKAVLHDPNEAYDLLFNKVLSQGFHDSCLTFDIVLFLQDNLEVICQNTNILSTYFPNIFKVSASWDNLLFKFNINKQKGIQYFIILIFYTNIRVVNFCKFLDNLCNTKFYHTLTDISMGPPCVCGWIWKYYSCYDVTRNSCGGRVTMYSYCFFFLDIFLKYIITNTLEQYGWITVNEYINL